MARTLNMQGYLDPCQPDEHFEDHKQFEAEKKKWALRLKRQDVVPPMYFGGSNNYGEYAGAKGLCKLSEDDGVVSIYHKLRKENEGHEFRKASYEVSEELYHGRMYGSLCRKLVAEADKLDFSEYTDDQDALAKIALYIDFMRETVKDHAEYTKYLGKKYSEWASYDFWE